VFYTSSTGTYTVSSMVVNLPLPPNGPTPLPQQPNDPPTLTDIANSVVYSQQLLISHRAKLIIRSLDLSPSLILQRLASQFPLQVMILGEEKFTKLNLFRLMLVQVSGTFSRQDESSTVHRCGSSLVCTSSGCWVGTIDSHCSCGEQLTSVTDQATLIFPVDI
jgi:hypothetical protein